MLSMLRCDLACLTGVARSNFIVALFVALVFAASIGTPAALAATMVTTCLTVMNNLMAIDEQNAWQTYRLALPLSRVQVVRGRYLSGLVGVVAGLLIGALAVAAVIGVMQGLPGEGAAFYGREVLTLPLEDYLVCAAAGLCVSLVGLAVALPLDFRLGFTAVTRYIPLAFAALFVLVVIVLDQFQVDSADISSIAALLSDPAALGLIGLAAFFVAAALYALSCMLSIRLYKAREL